MGVFKRMYVRAFPQHAMRRAYAQLAIDRIEFSRRTMRKYEAASQSSRLSLWTATDGSANSIIKESLAILRNRSRDLVRNNQWASHAVDVISTMVVGDGISPQILHLKKDTNSAAAERSVHLWSDWADTPACDFDGERTMVGIQAAVMDSVVTDGEVFVIRHRLSPRAAKRISGLYGNRTAIPIQLQLLESDFLDHHRNEIFTNGGKIIQGIEFDPQGRRVAYHFYKSHPGETRTIPWASSRDTVRVPADRVRHIFRKDRLHQSRGVTWFTKVMITLKELDTFEDASLRKQTIASCYAAFIIDPNVDDNETQEGLDVTGKLDSGTIETLPPGKDIKFTNPPAANDYPEFTKMQLRGIAAGLGLTYEALTQDLSTVNFSSGKMGQIGMNRKVRKWRKQILVTQLLDPVFLWWQEAADLVTPGGVDMSQLWSHWTMPANDYIDPGKEISANTEAIDSGQTTLSDILRSQGKDPHTVFQERAAELKLMDELGIRPPSTVPAKQGSSSGEGGTPLPKQNEGDESDSKDSDSRSAI